MKKSCPLPEERANYLSENFFICSEGDKEKLGVSENRIVKAENLLLATNIQNIQIKKKKKMKMEKRQYSVFHHYSSKGLWQTE